MLKIKEKQKIQDEAKRNVVTRQVLPAPINLNVEIYGGDVSPKIGNGIIQEDPNDEESDNDNEVQDFVKRGIVEMQR